MIHCHTKPWGNSLGIIIPRDIVKKHSLKPNEDIVIEIMGKVNVLKELFGSIKFKKSTKMILREAREQLESKL